MISDIETKVLHVVRVKGMASTDQVASAVGLPQPAVEAVLEGAAAEGWARLRTGTVAGWAITADGRAQHAARVAERLAASGLEPRMTNAYARFVAMNEAFKELCTRWQLHNKPASCVDELARVHADLLPVIGELAELDPRFALYAERFTEALERLQGGDTDALTRPLTGSYHDVWMELHQDLLLTLCRERTAADGH